MSDGHVTFLMRNVGLGVDLTEGVIGAQTCLSIVVRPGEIITCLPVHKSIIETIGGSPHTSG